MADVRIYRPAKSALSSGKARTRFWLVEFEPGERREADRLVGWVGSGDTRQQLRLRFPTREAAIAWCERHRLTYVVEEPEEPALRPRSYAENFLRRPV